MTFDPCGRRGRAGLWLAALMSLAPAGADAADAPRTGATAPSRVGEREVSAVLKAGSTRWLQALVLAVCLAVPAVTLAQAPPPPRSTAPAQPDDPPVRGLERLSPEERAQAERNLQRWREMTPEQRQRTQENYRQWKNLSP